MGMVMVRRIILVALIVAGAARAEAAQRTYSVTGFDRIRVEGPYRLEVRTGPSSSAKAVGDATAIDRLSVEVQGTTLIVRPDKTGWGGWPGAAAGSARILISTPSLSSVLMTGAADVAVDRVKGGDLNLQLMGSGSLSIAAIETDSLTAMLSGAGGLRLAGRSRLARLVLQGPGRLDAAQLSVDDAEINLVGTGDLAVEVERSAKVNAAGSGSVAITGPGSCIVRQSGTGAVDCAHRKAE